MALDARDFRFLCHLVPLCFVRWLFIAYRPKPVKRNILKCCLTDASRSRITDCMKKYRTTPEIEKAALKLGATHNQIYIWRKKGVSLSWRRLIATATRGRIKIGDFPEKAR